MLQCDVLRHASRVSSKKCSANTVQSMVQASMQVRCRYSAGTVQSQCACGAGVQVPFQVERHMFKTFQDSAFRSILLQNSHAWSFYRLGAAQGETSTQIQRPLPQTPLFRS